MHLDFERDIITIESLIKELQHLSNDNSLNITKEITKRKKEVEKALGSLYKKLTPWQKVQIARHIDRPKFLDYSASLFNSFIPLRGDRLFGEDSAIIGGIAKLNTTSVMVIGQHKGRSTEERIAHNFGMTRPEGYRKAQRLMKLAERFNLPILVFIDTPGASPMIEAEERGQSEAIAKTIEVTMDLKVPVIATIIGEGCSGGAIAIGSANYVLMLEHAIYSVITPEGCASILWRSATKAQEAANSQKLTADDLLQFKIIDEIIPEPIGGAHRYPDKTKTNVQSYIDKYLRIVTEKQGFDWQEHRVKKFLNITTNFS